MSRRRLTAEEIALWQKVVEKAHRISPRTETALPESPAPSSTPAAKPPTPAKLARPRRPQAAPAPQKPPSLPAPKPIGMDAKAYGRMKRGKLLPEGRIDLHGMTLDQAHPALTGFVLGAQSAGKRLVLVITGKGKPGDDYDPISRPRGVLSRQVPLWLGMAPMAQAVLQVTPAHLRHGGDGAFYVYLRRPR